MLQHESDILRQSNSRRSDGSDVHDPRVRRGALPNDAGKGMVPKYESIQNSYEDGRFAQKERKSGSMGTSNRYLQSTSNISAAEK